MRIIDLIFNIEIEEEKSYSLMGIGTSRNIIVDGDIIQATLGHSYHKRSNIANALKE